MLAKRLNLPTSFKLFDDLWAFARKTSDISKTLGKLQKKNFIFTLLQCQPIKKIHCKQKLFKIFKANVNLYDFEIINSISFSREFRSWSRCACGAAFGNKTVAARATAHRLEKEARLIATQVDGLRLKQPYQSHSNL